MALYKKQYMVGRGLYHAINCSRWNPEGRVLRMNPPQREIDQMWTRFRKSLKKMERERFLKKIGAAFIPNVDRMHESFFAMPLHGSRGYSFSRSDISYAQWVMKTYRDHFRVMKDWNDLELMVRILQKQRLQKPRLTAQLIFAAWLFQAD